MAEEIKVTGIIEDVQIYSDKNYFVKKFGCIDVDEFPRKRPEFYGDDDIIVVRVKTSDKKITDVFPVVLRYDGTLEKDALSRRSRLRRKRFAAFLKHYAPTIDIKKYNVVKKAKEWKGKKVEVETHLGKDQIFVPST